VPNTEGESRPAPQGGLERKIRSKPVISGASARIGRCGLALEPLLRVQQIRRDLFRHPIHALTEQVDEICPATLDFRQGQGQDLAFRFGFVGNAPAQVHFAPGDSPALVQASQLGRDLLDPKMDEMNTRISR